MELTGKLYNLFEENENTHWWFIGRRRVIFSFINRIISGQHRVNILDVGCGTGHILKKLDQYGAAIGIDSSKIAVTCSENRGCRDVRLTGEDRIPFPDSNFDFLFSLDVIEHINNDLMALNEYRRVLKPGGVLFLTVPAFNWIWSCHDDLNQHKRRYTRKLINDCLRQSGFQVERSSYFSTFLFPLIASTRILLRQIDKIYPLKKRTLDFHIPAWPFNGIFSNIFSSERRWLKYANLPFGSSILTIGHTIY